jgi:hypothetical protein
MMFPSLALLGEQRACHALPSRTSRIAIQPWPDLVPEG